MTGSFKLVAWEESVGGVQVGLSYQFLDVMAKFYNDKTFLSLGPM